MGEERATGEIPSAPGVAGAESHEGLIKADLDPNPVKQFDRWFQTALNAKLPEPNAMTLATSTPEGVPSARIVLLKAYAEDGFIFFTNRESQKGRELSANPHVALVLFWAQLERQVRVVGTAEEVSREESESYFHSRRIGSLEKPKELCGKFRMNTALRRHRRPVYVVRAGDWRRRNRILGLAIQYEIAFLPANAFLARTRELPAARVVGTPRRATPAPHA